jgi:anti-sigma regulatory factor (Ser/Thr protein kinase)
VRIAGQCELDESDAGRVAIVATELSRNLVKHSKEGELLVCGIQREGASGVELIALDKGPGMRDVEECMRDGYSTAGTPGTGLGAIRRIADVMDIYSVLKQGTVILARVLQRNREKPDQNKFQVGAVNVPVKGETSCGDAWTSSEQEGRLLAMVADGLGHGPDAAKASKQASTVLRECANQRPCEILEEMHAALRSTRGAAVSIAELRAGTPEVRFAGVGNVAGSILTMAAQRNMVSHNGTLGHAVRHCQEFTYPWSSNSLLVMHSDGITSQWDLRRYPGIQMRDPTVIAAVIYRDFKRGRDDATVFVAREAA